MSKIFTNWEFDAKKDYLACIYRFIYTYYVTFVNKTYLTFVIFYIIVKTANINLVFVSL